MHGAGSCHCLRVLHSHITKRYGLLEGPDGRRARGGLEDACGRTLWSLILFDVFTLVGNMVVVMAALMESAT